MKRALLLPTLLLQLLACSSGPSGDSGDAEESGSTASGASEAEQAPAPAAAPETSTGGGAEEASPEGASGGDTAMQTIRDYIEERAIDKENPRWRFQLPLPIKAEFDAKSDYFWVFETSEGPIRLRLFPEVAPLHVSNAIYLTETGFYDGLKFHRVIPNFMAQAGCPVGNGTGNPGYGIDGEYDSSVRHDRPGILSTANTGRPSSDGSQFFITFAPTPHLDGKHTIFGEVDGEQGMATLRALQRLGSRGGQTSKDILIERATIEVSPKE